jgi:hypothetical protein
MLWVGEQKLQRHPLLEKQVCGGYDSAHPPRADDVLDAVLSGEHVPGRNRKKTGGSHRDERITRSCRPRRVLG